MTTDRYAKMAETLMLNYCECASDLCTGEHVTEDAIAQALREAAAEALNRASRGFPMGPGTTASPAAAASAAASPGGGSDSRTGRTRPLLPRSDIGGERIE